MVPKRLRKWDFDFASRGAVPTYSSSTGSVRWGTPGTPGSAPKTCHHAYRPCVTGGGAGDRAARSS